MGYDLHITRSPEWSDTTNAQITLSEWRTYVRSDPEFAETDAAEAANPQTNEVIKVAQPGIAEWHRHSSGHVVWFAWWRGNIDVKTPDEEVILKMRSVAKALNARVQGDDGEWYEDETPVASESPRPSAVANSTITEVVARERPWWKFW